MNARGITQAPGTIIAGKYRLERPLARGGMGSVWVARHVQLKVELAVKFMAPSFAASPAARSRFEREAMASANLRSPHIVDIRDYGVDGDIPYLVMELLRGEDLGAKLKRERRLSISSTAAILNQVAKALRRAHEEGLIHRDLKPANIFLARDDDDQEIVKVLDFGIAKDTGIAASADVTGTGEMIGSPHYMSPEQIRSEKDLDSRSDLWSLGVIVFRALTGTLPADAHHLAIRDRSGNSGRPGVAPSGRRAGCWSDGVTRRSSAGPRWRTCRSWGSPRRRRSTASRRRA